MFSTHEQTGHYTPETTPHGIKAASMSLSVVTITLTAICIDRFVRSVSAWKELPVAQWTLFAFYCLSFLFSSVSAILKDLEPNTSRHLCDASILVCLVFYLSAKILQYHYLVERAHIVRSDRTPRSKDRIYIFNCCCLILPYIGLVILNFYWRVGYISPNGVCINGLEMQGIIPLLAFEILINIYMTLLYVYPFRRVLFKKQALGPNAILQAMAYRTALATCLMILVTVGNLIGLLALHGEPVWLCFMCCTGDVAVCVMLLHWVTKHDRERRGFAFSEELNQGLKLRPSQFNDAVIDAFCRATGMGAPEADGHIRVTKELKFAVNGQTVHVTTTHAEEDDTESTPTKGGRLSRHGSEDSMIEMERGEGRFRRRESHDRLSIGLSDESIGKGKKWQHTHSTL
ncbi:ring finger domain protein [Diplodia corticola]|uniref:Ring finger domain protein n=1 Tax=Diplodia corticola TaxID=236234 RepID=A0A1J9RD44_9PEZI|nr:ring finger domain protein [Diplodia corticola]OJD30443.1 ring finger domain protein [Diplodia corticola]